MPKYLSIALALALCFATGCHMFPNEGLAKSHSPLKLAQPSPDSVALEIIWARFPANDPVLDDAAWREIDETQIEPSVRRELVNNGIRAGIISGSVPPAIDRVLHRGEPKEDRAAENSKIAAVKQNADLITEPIIHGHIRHIPRNQRYEVQASEIYPSLPLLFSGASELAGHTYEKAQAIYALRVDPKPDRTAILEITPELHYGDAKLRFTGGDDGILRQAPLRERRIFDQLRTSVKIAPGEMLVLMSLPNAGSRLGHYFHTVDSADGPQQKLVLIRLAEVPPSDTFALTGAF
jgi:hypothetical protein